MTKPTFDRAPIASVGLSEHSPTLAHIEGGSFRHQSKLSGIAETIMKIEVGSIHIQTADPNWFRHLIDQANTALTSAGYPPHHSASNDDASQKDAAA